MPTPEPEASVELKACPACGSDNTKVSNATLGGYQVICYGPKGARCGMYGPMASTQNAARDKWNALPRHADKPASTSVELCAAIVADIEQDFTDRRGLRQEWEHIDDEIKEEIREKWRGVVGKRLEALPRESAGPDRQKLIAHLESKLSGAQRLQQPNWKPVVDAYSDLLKAVRCGDFNLSSKPDDSAKAIDRLGENHPLAPLFGKYNNEPLWDDLQEAIKQNRSTEEDDSAKQFDEWLTQFLITDDRSSQLVEEVQRKFRERFGITGETK